MSTVESESSKHQHPGPAGSIPPRQGRTTRRASASDLYARGEPFLWGFGGALALGIAMILGFLVLIYWNGIATFYPKPIESILLKSGDRIAGEPTRREIYRPGPQLLESLDPVIQKFIQKNHGYAERTLVRTGNYDLYYEDFRWVSDFEIQEVSRPNGLFFVERMEWGPFIGTVDSVNLSGTVVPGETITFRELREIRKAGEDRRRRIREIERKDIGRVNHYLDRERLKLRRLELKHGEQSPVVLEARKSYEARSAALRDQYAELEARASAIKEKDAAFTITLADVNGRKKTIRLSEIVRMVPSNDLSILQKLGVYLSRWAEFLTEEPREANAEGGVMPAIFGTFVMTVLMALAVAPFGVMTALYLREYARQGKMVSLVRICVNNLAGVPSIVYGVFGLGFFAYLVGGTIDSLFFPERLPNPTFGTGGVLWASLTLALLTVPVVIVATEEALAAVPQSMREGSLACGASKWQTIKYIVIPRAMPGIMTGLILAMARGAGEVAPLMLVGVVKMAPELPVDSFFPYFHLERSFMHLGFHIYDLGFQSRNSEAAKPMVFMTTLLLITLVAVMNAIAIYVRNRLKRKFLMGHF